MSHPYMPLYVSDYLGDTSHLTTLEHGAYMLLLMAYWQRGGPLSSDPHRLATIARVPTDVWTSVERTLSEFFTIDGETWRHERVDVELRKAAEKSEKARNAGKKSAAQRSDKQTSNVGSTDAQRTFNGRSTDVQPIQTHQRGLRDLSTSSVEQVAAREGSEDFEDCFDDGGDGARDQPEPPSFPIRRVKFPAATLRRAADKAGIVDATPLLDAYWLWQERLPPNKRAADPEANFVACAPRFFAKASAEVQALCLPPPPPPPPPLLVARPSSALAAKLIAKGFAHA